jgi:molybdopterin synthase sulfur carrier subunit
MAAMARVRLRAPLSELCGGREHEIEGATVSDVLKALEREHPPIAGWVLDERGRIREHVNVFVNGSQGEEQTQVAESDCVHVLPAITGG